MRRARPWVLLLAFAAAGAWLGYRLIDPLRGFDPKRSWAIATLTSENVILDREWDGRISGAHFDLATKASLSPLEHLPDLKNLGLRGSEMTDGDLVCLEHLKNIQRLAMANCPRLTDVGMGHLGPLANLSILDISDTNITDAGLSQLKSLPRLEIVLAFDTKITPAGVAALRAARPKVGIQWQTRPAVAPGGKPEGPARGTILLCSIATPQIRDRFIALAGGDSARIVVIANDFFPEIPYRAIAASEFGKWPVRNLTIWHAGDTQQASSPKFLADLRQASGVWLPGGFVKVLADPYIGSPANAELQALLDRGGVIGGASAGAIILASHAFPQGANSAECIQGFGFLHDIAIFPHLGSNRWLLPDAQQRIQDRPGLLGIALSDDAAVLIRADNVEMFGSGEVALIRAGPKQESQIKQLRNGERESLSK